MWGTPDYIKGSCVYRRVIELWKLAWRREWDKRRRKKKSVDLNDFPGKNTGKWKWKWSPSVVTLCHPMDCSLPGSSLHRILQARVLEWGAISFSRGSSPPRVSHTAGKLFTDWATREIGHRTGKGPFSFQSQRKAMPKNAQTTALLHSSHMLVN